MKETFDYARCADVLKRELLLLEKTAAVQESVRQAVLDREWTDFDWKIAEINQLGRDFAELEDERKALFAARPGEDFYALTAGLPEAERRELAALYRRVKMETLRVKALNESFEAYVNEARLLAAAYLDALFPARNGRLYTKSGFAAGETRSVVLNQSV